MDCTRCGRRSCRTAESCGGERFDRQAVAGAYHDPDTAPAVQAAARLVDGGRAGTLSRVDELIEYIGDMGLRKIGLAYCYGMEKEALTAAKIFREAGVRVEAVSCTVGALAQKDVNSLSDLEGVSCNPLGQAAQLNAADPELTITMGLCLGHDILFNRHIQGDVTTLVVKDRVHEHAPLLGLADREPSV